MEKNQSKPLSEVIVTEKRMFIRAEEIFIVFMNNFFRPDLDKIMADFVNNDPRKLTKLSSWLLKRRGYYNLVKTKNETK